MATVDGGQLVARIMRENRARYCFAINGGHLFPILAQLRNHEIKLMQGETDTVIGYAILGEIIGADFFSAVAASDHAAALRA